MPLDPKIQMPYYNIIDTLPPTPIPGYYANIYNATIAQTSTNAPTANEASTNTITAVTYTRTGTGEYKLSKTTTFPANKTFILVWPNLGSNTFEVKIYRLSSDDIKIETYASGTLTDGLMTDTQLQIFTTP